VHAKHRLATCLDRIDRLDGELRAFITVTGRSARKQAAAIGSANRDRPLAGVIVAVKDCIDTAGIRTTQGSPIFADRIPAADATIVARLKRAGAILIGKTNLHEFAMGATTQNATFGSCRNPWDLSRTPGGSSGGSAVAVATGMCDIALGTDTGGSIRNPATFTGIVGLRPTIGRIPMRGVLRVSPTIDTAGPMARSVREAAQAYAVLAKDRDAVPGAPEALKDLVRGLRIGRLRGYFETGVDAGIVVAAHDAAAVFESAGARIGEADIPGVGDVEEALGLCIMVADAAAVHAARLRRQPERLDPGVRQRLEVGLHRSAGEYARAMRVVARWRAAVERTFASFDALMAPGTAFSAPRIDELGPLTGISTRINHLNIPWSGAGTPVLALPAGFDRAGLPIGIQLVAPWWREASLLALGAWYQTVTDWHCAVPPLLRSGGKIRP
jgi:aspartyl-tRNA(Asn)/glutamyl-tRNA(Gln) amidotransferase subunit A